MLNRRTFLTGLVAVVAAPAIVRSGVLDPIRGRRLLTEDVTYYVAVDGSDEFDGLTPERAVRTMQKLLDKIDANDRTVTIQIASGVYGENLDAANLNGDLTLHTTAAAYVVFDGMNIKGVANKHNPLFLATDLSVLDLRGSCFAIKDDPMASCAVIETPSGMGCSGWVMGRVYGPAR